MAKLVAKDAGSVVGPDTPLATSETVTRQNNVVSAGKSTFGVNDVRGEPSLTVPVARIGLNAALAATSNLYVNAPTGPERVALVTVNVGRAPVPAPLMGLTSVAESMTIAGPIVNARAALNGPVVPPPSARACQK